MHMPVKHLETVEHQREIIILCPPNLSKVNGLAGNNVEDNEKQRRSRSDLEGENSGLYGYIL